MQETHLARGTKITKKTNGTSNRLDLDEMSIDDLLELRERVNDVLKGRLDSERRALEDRLAKLNEVAADGASDGSRPSPLKGRKVAPKYRNPENPSQTWAGRGQMPSWLAAAVAEGADLADFEIASSLDGPSSRDRKRKRG